MKRGVWEKITINQKIIECMITFHPSYLLKKPEEKKLSWIHLKNIKKKAEILNLKI
jgi:DNA polymerase